MSTSKNNAGRPKNEERQTFPPIWCHVKYDPETSLEKWPVSNIGLGDRESNALKRIGINTVGQVMDNWNRLTEIRPKKKNANGKITSSGLGKLSEQRIHAAVFALLCSEAKVDLGINLTGCE